MKTIRLVLLLSLILLAGRLCAQTTYLSNLAETVSNGIYLVDNRVLARGFVTGANLGGYELNHVTLDLNSPATPDPDFTVQLWSDDSGTPGASLGDFAFVGSGQFTWAGITLDPSTTYWLTLTSPNGYSSSSYCWNLTDSTASESQGGWVMLTGAKISENAGLSWGGSGHDHKYSVTATALASPIPEPSTYAALAGLAALTGAVIARRRRVSTHAL